MGSRNYTYDSDDEWSKLYEAAGEDEDMLAELEQAEEEGHRFSPRSIYDGMHAELVPNLVYEMPQVRKMDEAWPTIFVPAESEAGWSENEYSLLLALPAELRNQVYENYFNSRNLMDEPELAAQPPDSDDEEYEYMLAPRMPRPEVQKRENSDSCIEDVTRWTTTIDFGTENVEGLKHLISRPLLQVSRQVRSETLPIAIEGKLWMTANVRVFPNLLKCLGPRLWNYITNIHIEDPFFPCGYEDPKPCFPAFDDAFHYPQNMNSETEGMEGFGPDKPIDAITASHPIFEGSYSAALIKTIAALPHLQNLYMAFFMAGKCKFSTILPDIDRLANVDLGHGSQATCPSFQALADFIGKGMKTFVLEYVDAGPGLRAEYGSGHRLFMGNLGRMACETAENR